MNSEEQIEDLLDQWEEARESGESISPESLCAECPELLPKLKEQITVLEKMEQRLKTDHATHEMTNRGYRHDSDTHIPQHFENEKLTTQSNYEAIRFLARGGLGAVYQAQDSRLHREVALKFLHRRLGDNEELKEQFFIEAEITSRLQHPGVVPVHGVGETESGRPFYSMRMIDGESLEEAIKQFHENANSMNPQDRRVAFHNLLSRFVSVCQTIAYAHNCGIIHRDIKPDNIMLGRFGETLVVDWGLAIPVGRDERAKASGERTLVLKGENQTSNSGVGTPAYMSPEQHMEAEQIYPASDIYALGVTLYKLLTGKMPFVAKQFYELKQKIFRGEFQPPRTVKADIPRSLEAVCMKAMAVSSDLRYETAMELSDEITRYLDDLPVKAKPESLTGRAFRWTRRHRGSSLTALAALILFSFSTFLASVWFNQLAVSEYASRVKAETAEVGNLKLSSQFAARTIASEIDQRWLVLEMEANSTLLKTQLNKINENPDDKSLWEPLQAWVNQKFIKHNDAINAKSWFIDSYEGVQISRSPYSANSIGKNWRFRNYFHGRGKDMDPEEAAKEKVPPIESVFFSNPFRSKSTNTLMVAFTVPIWSHEIGDTNRKVIGVLGLSVELGEFKSLEGGLVLVDTHEDWVEGESHKGRILHHPDLNQTETSGDESQENTPRINNGLLERLIDFQDEIVKEPTPGALPPSMMTGAYLDPFTENPIPNRAACTPILIPGRETKIKNTGWVVIVPDLIRNDGTNWKQDSFR